MTENLHRDPFDEMSDEQFENWVLSTLRKPLSTHVSLRIPTDLLERTKRQAERRGVPYQGLMKALIERGIERLEARSA